MIFLYEFKLDHKGAAISHNINQFFGKGIVNDPTIQRWFRKFRDGDESLEDEGGWPSTVDNDELRLVTANPRITARGLADELSVSHPTVLDNLKQLGK